MAATICSYSEKAVVVRGEKTKQFTNEFKSIGGRWNPHLKDGPGWIFSKSKTDQIEKIINYNLIEKLSNIKITENNDWDSLIYRKKWLIEEWDKLKTIHNISKWKLIVNSRLCNTAGRCKYTPEEIDIAQTLLNKPDTTRDNIMNTLLHEIAHAITGPKHHHDAVWKANAIKIGCTGDRCHTLKLGKEKAVVLQMCSKNCEYNEYPKFRYTDKMKNTKRICGKCKTNVTYL